MTRTPGAFWHKRRARKALHRPLPVAVVEVNGMSASGVPRAKSEDILHRASKYADVILGCEFSNLDDDPLDPHDWTWFHEPADPSKAGSFLAVRRSRGRIEHARLRRGCPGGFGIRARWLIVARLHIDPGTINAWRPKAVAGHAPPMRAWPLWATFMASVVARRADIAGADWNKLARAVLPALRRKVRMVHILGIAVRWWIPATEPRALDVGGDHEAVATTLWPTKEHR